MTHPFKAEVVRHAGAKILNWLCLPRWDFRAASESAPVGRVKEPPAANVDQASAHAPRSPFTPARISLIPPRDVRLIYEWDEDCSGRLDPDHAVLSPDYSRLERHRFAIVRGLDAQRLTFWLYTPDSLAKADRRLSG
jgi:hypothetical protein